MRPLGATRLCSGFEVLKEPHCFMSGVDGHIVSRAGACCALALLFCEALPSQATTADASRACLCQQQQHVHRLCQKLQCFRLELCAS